MAPKFQNVRNEDVRAIKDASGKSKHTKKHITLWGRRKKDISRKNSEGVGLGGESEGERRSFLSPSPSLPPYFFPSFSDFAPTPLSERLEQTNTNKDSNR